MTQPPRAGAQAPFADLPASLVEEILVHTDPLVYKLVGSFTKVNANRGSWRTRLDDAGLLRRDSDYPDAQLPTTCAADGSYVVERLLTTDVATAAAVAVEGLTPPSEHRHWPEPQHTSFVSSERHAAETATVLRAVMLGEEYKLLTQAPHELLMVDGTFALPIIYFNQALSGLKHASGLTCAKELANNCVDYLTACLATLRAIQTHKQYIAIPKYSTRREIGYQQQWPPHHDDRGMLTLLLEPGELTRPCPFALEDSTAGWHIGTHNLPDHARAKAKRLSDDLAHAVTQLKVFYYKPKPWLPALRVEVAAAVADNPSRMAIVLHGIRHQCASPSMFEPYPLYLADRMVKALARAVPALRQVTTQGVAERFGEVTGEDIGKIFLAMHSYRSETGR